MANFVKLFDHSSHVTQLDSAHLINVIFVEGMEWNRVRINAINITMDY